MIARVSTCTRRWHLVNAHIHRSSTDSVKDVLGSFLQESDKGWKVLKHFNGCQNNGYYLALIKDDNTGIPADTCNQCTPVRKSMHPKRNSFFLREQIFMQVGKEEHFCLIWETHYDCFVPFEPSSPVYLQMPTLYLSKVMNKVSIVKKSVVYYIKICSILSSKE